MHSANISMLNQKYPQIQEDLECYQIVEMQQIEHQVLMSAVHQQHI